MDMINYSMVEGTITKDAELKYTQSGIAIVTFSIANNVFQGKEKPEYTNFFNIVMFGKLGEKWANYLIKGITILATAQSRIETYEKDGVNRQAHKYIIGYGHTLRVVRKSKEAEARLANIGNQSTGYAQQQQYQQPSQGFQQQPYTPPPNKAYQPSAPAKQEEFQDDIPF